MRALVLFLLLGLAGCARPVDLPAKAPDTLRIATHNVHFVKLARDRGPWSVADWEARKHALDAVFKETKADLVAFQEMVSIGSTQDRSVNLARDWLLDRNPGYALAATGDWRSFPTRQPIFFRSDRLSLRDQGWFLFDSPQEAARQRARRGFWLYYASWADFTDLSGAHFRVYNVHFHFLNGAKRRQAAHKVAHHAAPLLDAGVPVLVLGDMNTLRGWRPVQLLRNAGLRIAQPPGASFHFNRGLNVLGAIDRFVHAPAITVVNGPWALQGRRAGDWPSDHYPVVAEVSLP
jgi:endonuclease/exonuclease/phosphatase family metal-dependent hydrolase